MSSQEKVDIEVANRKLTIACPKGQESALKEAALELNSRLIKHSKSALSKSLEQSLLMAALNLAHDLIALQEKHLTETQQMQSKIDLLQNTIKTAVQKSHEAKTELANSITHKQHKQHKQVING